MEVFPEPEGAVIMMILFFMAMCKEKKEKPKQEEWLSFLWLEDVIRLKNQIYKRSIF